MDELNIDNSSLVVTLNSESLLPGNTFVLSGDNSNLFTSSGMYSYFNLKNIYLIGIYN